MKAAALLGGIVLLFVLCGAQPVRAQREQPPIVATFGQWQVVDPSFAPEAGAQAYSGILGRAAFRIEIPANWNHELVLYAHGLHIATPLLTVENPPIRDHLLAEGFAWAASSYSANGYDPDVGLADTLALRDYFGRTFGAPARSYIFGESMGGHVVVSALEQHPGLFDGAFAACGALMQEGEIDYILTYIAAMGAVANAQLLPVSDLESFRAAVTQDVLPVLGVPGALTPLGQTFADVIENLTGGPRPFRQQGFADFYTGPLAAGYFEGPNSIAAEAATDQDVTLHAVPGDVIDDATLNARLYRQPPNLLLRDPSTDPTFSLPTGHITVPLMTYHTTGDNFVPISNEIDYRRLVNAAGAGDLLVQRAVRAPDHCEFAQADLAQGWDDLIAWVEQGVKPQGDDYLAPDLTDLGRRWTHDVLPGDESGY